MKPQYERIADLIESRYGDRPDFPWREFPDYEVFRHRQTRKWYGLVMNVPPEKLYAKNQTERFRLPSSITDKKEIHIIDLKIPQDEIPSLDQTEDIFPAYHMNAGYWISVLLEDRSTPGCSTVFTILPAHCGKSTWPGAISVLPAAFT